MTPYVLNIASINEMMRGHAHIFCMYHIINIIILSFQRVKWTLDHCAPVCTVLLDDLHVFGFIWSPNLSAHEMIAAIIDVQTLTHTYETNDWYPDTDRRNNRRGFLSCRTRRDQVRFRCSRFGLRMCGFGGHCPSDREAAAILMRTTPDARRESQSEES